MNTEDAKILVDNLLHTAKHAVEGALSLGREFGVEFDDARKHAEREFEATRFKSFVCLA